MESERMLPSLLTELTYAYVLQWWFKTITKFEAYDSRQNCDFQ